MGLVKHLADEGYGYLGRDLRASALDSPDLVPRRSLHRDRHVGDSR